MNTLRRNLIILAILYSICTVPFQSHWPISWDASQFTLGIMHFSVHMHQPHPPGYPIFILVGKLFALAVVPHSALVIESMLFGLGAVLLMYCLVLELWKKPWLAFSIAVLWMVNPMFWFYREAALTYSIDACASIALAWLTWLALRTRQHRYVYISVITLALAAGFRPSLAILFLPFILWQYAVHIRNWRMLLRATGVGMIIVLAWLIPLIIAAGGIAQYQIDSASLYEVSASNASIFAGASWQLTWSQTQYVFTTLAESYNIVLIFLLAGLITLALKAKQHKLLLWWALVWCVPSLFVYCLVHFGQLGYALTIIPLGYVLMAPVLLWAEHHWQDSRPYIFFGVGVLVLLQSSVFLMFSPDYTHPEYFPHTRADIFLQRAAHSYPNLFKLNTTVIQRNDDRLQALHDLVQQYDSTKTIVVTGRNILYPASNGLQVRNDELFRQLSAILPNYQVVEVAPNRDYVLQADNATMQTIKHHAVIVPDTTTYVIFALDMIPSSSQPSGIILEQRALPAGDMHYYLGIMDKPFSFEGITFKRTADL